MIKTPLTDPNHDVVGRYFAGGHTPGVIYYCDSWDSRWGYWMRDVESSPEFEQDQESKYRRNVSERAINATFWRIYVENDNLGQFIHTGLGGWTGREKFKQLILEGRVVLRESEKPR